ncbi:MULTISPECIES: hypothetical protein [Novosphingobium]|uniref:hypothetical protein n=1 Tax=Novosphingobium TaxID=165696 RepID=UPI0022F28A20|nr:hypothetical protein [Novosphingobium resinovorum]GLK47021.1 hypothetical protein GCM10017612_49430 [Novosphingobium resinovorum]
MSRYEFPGRSEGVRVSMGWDRPLATFFVQVTQSGGGRDEQDDMLVWQGTCPGEISTAAQAVRIARDHADLPDGLGRVLETDRLRTLGIEDGPAQRAGKDLIARNARR